MISKSLFLGSVLGLSVFFSGCATILDGKTQSINLISSKPQTVSIDGKQYNAPSVISLERTNKDKVLKLDGCAKTILLKKEINPTFFVNILSGGAFGSTTDYSTDSMWQYDQNNVETECK